MTSIKKSCLDVLANLRESWQQVLMVHLIFTALGFILFSPLLAGIGQLLLGISGQPALDDQDILYFFLSPFGMIAMILMLALLIAVVAFEQAALMRVAAGVMHGQQISIVESLVFTASRVGRLFVFILKLVIRVLLLTLPFLAVAYALVTFLLSDYDFNYYLAQRPTEFWWATALVSLVLIFMLLVLIRKLLGWSLALPLVLFANVLPRKSFSASNRLTNGTLTSVFSLLMVWAVAAMVPGFILLGLFRFFGWWLIPVVQGSISGLLVLLGVFSVLWLLTNFLITAFTSGSFAYLIVALLESYLPESEVLQTRPSASGSSKIHFSRRGIAMVLITGVVAAGFAGAWLIEGIPLDDDVLIVAHRGAAGKAPENTLAAFRQAIEDGTDWIELDVQETADGEVIVFHDGDFMKLAGNGLKVRDASFAQTQEIDIGSWFDPAFLNERPPSLTEALETARGKVNVVIELKYYGDDQKLEQRVVDIVEAADMVNHTAIMSLKYDALRKVRALRPDWQLGLLSAKALGDLSSLDTDFLAVQMGMARTGFIRRVHHVGKKVFVWTVNDPVSMSRMMSLGVDGIITDEPEMARQVLLERQDMNIAERLLVHTALLFGQPYRPHRFRDESP